MSLHAQALYNHSEVGYKMSNRWVLRRDRKTATEGAEVTCSGRLFQQRLISNEDELERRCV